jgi:puromycin-sensitive aminopeptidase
MTDHAPTPQEQLRYLYALPLFRSRQSLDRTLGAALDGGIRTQNAPFVLAFAMTSREQGAHAWSFVKDHWERLNEIFPSTLVIRMVEGVRYLTRPSDVADAQAFFADHPIPQSEKSLQQLLERQRITAALRGRAELDLAARFEV